MKMWLSFFGAGFAGGSLVTCMCYQKYNTKMYNTAYNKKMMEILEESEKIREHAKKINEKFEKSDKQLEKNI